MRKLLFSALLLMPFASHAITIDLPGYDFAATVNSASLTGDFLSNPAPASGAITDLMTTSYVYSPSTPAYIDMTFGDGTNTVSIADGAGFDVSVFLIDASTHIFTLSLFNDGNLLGAQSYNTDTYANVSYTGACIDIGNDGDCSGANDLPIWDMEIDFATFGIGNAAVDSLRLELSGYSAVPSLIGANYIASNSTVVPLPLPALLFASGLGVLGLFGRRSRTSRG